SSSSFLAPMDSIAFSTVSTNTSSFFSELISDTLSSDTYDFPSLCYCWFIFFIVVFGLSSSSSFPFICHLPFLFLLYSFVFFFLCSPFCFLFLNTNTEVTYTYFLVTLLFFSLCSLFSIPFFCIFSGPNTVLSFYYIFNRVFCRFL